MLQLLGTQNSDCSICIRVCPYNKDYSKWYTRLGSRLAGTRLRGLMLRLDSAMGYGQRMRARQWWNGERESLSVRMAQLLGRRKRSKP